MLLMLGVNRSDPVVHLKLPVSNPKIQHQIQPARSQGDPMAGSPRCIGFNLQLVKPNLCRNVGNLQFKMSVVGMDFPKTIKKTQRIYKYRYMYVYRNRCAKSYIYIVVSFCLGYIITKPCLSHREGCQNQVAHHFKKSREFCMHIGTSAPPIPTLRKSCVFSSIFFRAFSLWVRLSPSVGRCLPGYFSVRKK